MDPTARTNMTISLLESDIAGLTLRAATGGKTMAVVASDIIHDFVTKPPNHAMAPVLTAVMSGIGDLGAMVSAQAKAMGIDLAAAGTAADTTPAGGPACDRPLPIIPAVDPCAFSKSTGPTPTCGWGPSGRPSRGQPAPGYAEWRKQLFL